MGIDYYACKQCGETFPDCGHFVRCECGNKWCSDECAEYDGYEYKEWTDENGDECYHKGCKYCRQEDFTDSQLLEYVLSQSNLTREKLVHFLKTDTELTIIGKNRYKSLSKKEDKLDALECAGVDNWEGYGIAMSEMYYTEEE